MGLTGSSNESSDDEAVQENGFLSGKLSKYRIERFLCEGGFGKVAQCIKLDTKENVAVRLMRLEGYDMDSLTSELLMSQEVRKLDPDKNNIVKLERISSEPVEDTDTTSFVTEFSLEANYPVQVTDPHADAVTLHLSSMSSGYLSPSSDRIKQPVEDVEECTCPTSTSPDYPKELQLLTSPCEKCCCPAPPPKISDLMNDKDLLDLLRLKLDPNHCTIKNWKNFASRWGMSYDELTLLEHRTQGSLSHSPTQEFLLRYSQKTVTELTELCRIYQRIDVLRLLQSWIEKDWPSRWQQAH